MTAGSSYRPSGRMPFSGWGPLLGLWGLAAASGGIEAFIYSSKPFMAWLIVMALGMWIGFAGTFFIRWARCRNRWIALLVGLAAGVLLLATGWAIDRHMERGAADESTFLEYMMWRVETGKHVGLADDSGDPARLDGLQLMASWAGFFTQVLITLFLTTLLPWRTVRTDPYCEACAAWMTRDIFALDADEGGAELAAGAVRDGRLHELLEARSEPYNPGAVATLVAVHACPDGRGCGRAEGWASIDEADGSPSLAGHFHPSNVFFGRITMELGRIEPRDLAAMLPRLASSRDGAAFLSESSLSELLEDEGASKIAPGEAMIEDVRDRTAGAVLGKRSLVMTLLFQLIPLFAIFGGLFGLYFLIDLEILGALGAPLAWLVGAALVFIVILFFRDVNFFEGLLPYLEMKGSLRSRADRLVEPDDPGAYFVDVIPRANWGRTMLENASDIGFLKVDAEGERLLFEGDRQRYRIPVTRIIAFELTHLGASVKTAGIETTQRPVLVLHVDDGGRSIEMPLVLRHSTVWRSLRHGSRGNFNRMARAVHALLPEQPSGPTTPYG